MSDRWAVLFLAAALVSLVQLVRPRLSGELFLASREAHGVHVVMNLAMAAMASSLWTASGRAATLAVLLLAAAVLLLHCVRPGRSGQRAGSAYHLLGVAAMLWAGWRMPAMATPMAGMAGMGGAMAPGGGWAETLLGLLFALDGLTTFVLGILAPRLLLRMEAATGARPSATPVAVLRLSAIPHVVMDLGMAAMLL